MKKIFLQIFVLIVLIILLSVMLAITGKKIKWPVFNNSSYLNTKNNHVDVDIPLIENNNNLTYFGNEITTDLNGDGTLDRAYVATEDGGGSGTFYYLVGELGTMNGNVEFDRVLLGDRIAPQTTEVGWTLKDARNVVVVNYADRLPSESFVTPPTVGMSKYLLYDPVSGKFGIIEKDFEGEVDPAMMNITMKRWDWVETIDMNGSSVVPVQPERFGLEFVNGSTVTIFTDCNTAGGEYSIDGNNLKIFNTISTLMFCVGSQEQEYMAMINNVESYKFTSRGELILNLKEGGEIVYK